MAGANFWFEPTCLNPEVRASDNARIVCASDSRAELDEMSARDEEQ